MYFNTYRQDNIGWALGTKAFAATLSWGNNCTPHIFHVTVELWISIMEIQNEFYLDIYKHISMGKNLYFTHCTFSAELSHGDWRKSLCWLISSKGNGEWGTRWTPCTPSRALLVFNALWVHIKLIGNPSNVQKCPYRLNLKCH